MNGLARNSHPEPEVLAAFVDGNIEGSELVRLSDHLRDCEECRMIAGEAAQFEQPAGEPAVRNTRLWWGAAAAAVILAIIGINYRVRQASSDPFARLLVAASAMERHTPARISGIAFTPVRSASRSGRDVKPASQLKTQGAAGDVLEATENATAARDLHARGVAHLLAGQLEPAIEALRAATTADPKSASYWNDLAAAYYREAIDEQRPAELLLALAATRHALGIAPDSQETLFNRALIIEALGPEQHAVDAWNEYLKRDAQSAWAGEAREHIRDLTSRKVSSLTPGDRTSL